jgi:hypothetical protein
MRDCCDEVLPGAARGRGHIWSDNIGCLCSACVSGDRSLEIIPLRAEPKKETGLRAACERCADSGEMKKQPAAGAAGRCRLSG